jgi:putative DNA primase/helicase
MNVEKQDRGHRSGVASSSSSGAPRRVLERSFVRADSVTPKNPQWLMTPMGRGWVARTGPTILAGMQDLGKTGLAMSIAARVSESGSVLVFSAEDDPETTLVPRLIAAGADLERVHIFREDEGFWPTESSTGLLDEALRESKAKLVIFDPLLAYFSSGTDSHRDRDVRAVLRRLHAVSLHRRAALIGLMHFNKGDHAEILHYISSSIAFTAGPRSVLAMVPSLDPDDDSTVLIHAKCNVAMKQKSRVLLKESVKVADGKVKTYRTIIGEETDVTAQNYVAKRHEAARQQDESQRPNKQSALDEAVEDLVGFLDKGPQTGAEVWAWMEENGHSKRTVRRARSEAGIVLEVDPAGRPGRDYIWRLVEGDF